MSPLVQQIPEQTVAVAIRRRCIVGRDDHECSVRKRSVNLDLGVYPVRHYNSYILPHPTTRGRYGPCNIPANGTLKELSKVV
jgi:hypothetical protein